MGVGLGRSGVGGGGAGEEVVEKSSGRGKDQGEGGESQVGFEHQPDERSEAPDERSEAPDERSEAPDEQSEAPDERSEAG